MKAAYTSCFLATAVATVLGSARRLSASGASCRIIPVAEGWAKNSVNTPIFRASAVTTHADNQYVAFYDEDSHVVLAKRNLNSTSWRIHKTAYKGDAADAHNSISIAVDGSGVLHMSWDQHCDPLRYCQAVAPGALEPTSTLPMTGHDEDRVTYPEFYSLPDGDLLFLYRDGSSGDGNTMLNHYDTETCRWSIVQHPLIDGQGQRNAYTNQMAIDRRGHWHISWCWRETGDVSTNHDLCYAKSTDGGISWQKSTGEKYNLPITAENAEYIRRIPQNHELINQTSMTVDSKGRPVIVGYWRPENTDVPQYHVAYFEGATWQTRQVSRRVSAFRLSGRGTKRLPMSRPKVLADADGRVYVLFRDSERASRASIAVCQDADYVDWRVLDLTTESVGEWEPNYDPVLWERQNVLHLFLQRVEQQDRDVLQDVAPQMISILEWTPE
jgi:hypothetical protein